MEPKFKDKAEFVQWFDSAEGKEIAHPAFDVKVNAAIQTYIRKHPDSKELGPRLDEIETAIAAKDAELEKETLSHFAYRTCIENNVDFDLLSGYPLTDEKSIIEKVSQLGKVGALEIEKKVNERLLSTTKPKLGMGHDGPSVKTEADYILEAEERDRRARA